MNAADRKTLAKAAALIEEAQGLVQEIAEGSRRSSTTLPRACKTPSAASG